jgi:hypothetical protein
MECGDQVLRNFLNGLVIHFRGTKENPKNAMDVIRKNQSEVKQNIAAKKPTSNATSEKPPETKKPASGFKKTGVKPSFKDKKPAKKIEIVEKVKFNNGKKKS